MSNARYFANGTEFYRVLYDNGSTDGPYIRTSSARAVGKRATRLRQNYAGWGADRKLVSEYRLHESYKLQKLMPAREECGCCLTLEWEDWNE